MPTIEARAADELRRLQGRTSTALTLALVALAAALALTLPAVWFLSGKLLSVELERTSFVLRSARGEVKLQQSLAAGPAGFILYFTVGGAGGLPVRGLGHFDLEVSTDELGPIETFDLAPVTSERDPLSLFVALDTSSAVASDGRLPAAREAIRDWVKQLAPYQAALIGFGGQPRYESELGLPDLKFYRALDGLSTGGGPALFDAVVLAADRAEGRETRMALVAVAGGDDQASKTRVSEAWSRAHAAALPVFAVPMGAGINQEPLEELARKTGGAVLAAPDASALPAALNEVSDRLCSEYRLSVPASLPRPATPAARATATCLAAGILLALYVAFRRWLKTPELVVLGGPKHGLAVRLSAEILVCGSDPGCHLQVPGELKTTAGRRFALEHRRFGPGGSTVSFHLLDPSGATTVNRTPVESRDLVSGDVIRAGLARFVFFRYTSRQGRSTEAPPAPSLRVTDPFWIVSEDGGPVFKVDGERVRVGREPDNEVVLEDPSVSRRHAEFVRSEEGFDIVDLGSRNGTYLGESRVGSQSPLHDGQRLRFGRIKFQVSRIPPGDDPFEFGDLSELAVEQPQPAAVPPAVPLPEPRAAEPRALAPEAPEPPAAEAKPAASEAAPAAPREEGSCPVCSHVNRPAARYCTQCGEKLV